MALDLMKKHGVPGTAVARGMTRETNRLVAAARTSAARIILHE